MGCSCPRSESAAAILPLSKNQPSGLINLPEAQINLPRQNSKESGHENSTKIVTNKGDSQPDPQLNGVPEAKEAEEDFDLVEAFKKSKMLEEFRNPKQYILLIWSNDEAVFEWYKKDPLKYLKVSSPKSALL